MLTRVARYGDILSLEYGRALPEAQRDANGQVVVAGSNGAQGTHSRWLAAAPAIVIGRKGSAGRVTWFDQNVWPIDTTYYVVPSCEVDPRWLFYALRAARLERLATATGVPGLHRDDVYRLEVTLPPLPEQQRIARLMDEAGALEGLRIRADAATENIVAALFYSAFGDPVSNPLCFPVLPAGELMVACEYGTSTRANDEGRGVPMIRMNNVTSAGLLDTSDLKTVELTDAEMAKYRLTAGDVLFNRTNSRDLVGKTGLWDGRFDAVAASYFIRVRFDTEREHPQHFTTFMNLPALKRQLRSMARGAIGQANINAQELRSIRVPVPPIEIQREFAAQVDEVRALAERQVESRRQLALLRDSLTHRAFSGTL